MIIAWHLGWTCYGWWFPNDLRGSWSKETWQPRLKGLGPIHLGRREVQPRPEALREWQSEARGKLKYDVMVLDGRAALDAAKAIGKVVRSADYVVRAFAIMRDHVHVVVMGHAHRYERIVAAMKAVSARAVRELRGMNQGRRKRDPVWSKGYWVRYINDDGGLRNAIRYVERNPVKAGLPKQQWSFVSPV